MTELESGPPQYPAGAFVAPEGYAAQAVTEARQQLAVAPQRLRAAIAGLNDTQLETRYRNWSIRQITNHVADSHLHSLIRCKWALTEDNPTIKAYFEDRWAELPDAKYGDVETSLALLDAIHASFVAMIDTLSPEQCQRTFFHPESRTTNPLWHTFSQYAWHAQHHTAQIVWIRQQNGW